VAKCSSHDAYTPYVPGYILDGDEVFSALCLEYDGDTSEIFETKVHVQNYS
jgi:hypothetical protein